MKDVALTTWDPELTPMSSFQTHEIRQQLIFGKSPLEIANELNLPVEAIIWTLEHSPEFCVLTPRHRKQIALARAEYLQAEMIRRAPGPEGIAATSAWVALQKRESALTGMDSPEKQESTVKIELSWLTASRFKYKENSELAPDIEEAKLLPPAPRAREKPDDQSE